MASEGSAASNGEQTRSCSQELESRLEFEKGKKKQEDSAVRFEMDQFCFPTELHAAELVQDCSKTVQVFDLDDLALGAGKQEANAPAEEGTR